MSDMQDHTGIFQELPANPGERWQAAVDLAAVLVDLRAGLAVDAVPGRPTGRDPRPVVAGLPVVRAGRGSCAGAVCTGVTATGARRLPARARSTAWS